MERWRALRRTAPPPTEEHCLLPARRTFYNTLCFRTDNHGALPRMSTAHREMIVTPKDLHPPRCERARREKALMRHPNKKRRRKSGRGTVIIIPGVCVKDFPFGRGLPSSRVFFFAEGALEATAPTSQLGTKRDQASRLVTSFSFHVGALWRPPAQQKTPLLYYVVSLLLPSPLGHQPQRVPRPVIVGRARVGDTHKHQHVPEMGTCEL